jgi:hypothetical protein
MGKINVTLTDETEKKLRAYVASKYPKQQFGKLSKVVEISVRDYLEKQKDGHIDSTQAFY